MADLEKMILAKRENNFNGFLNYMTNKYGGDDDINKSKKKTGKKEQNQDEEMDDWESEEEDEDMPVTKKN